MTAQLRSLNDFKHLTRKGADIDAVAGDDDVIDLELRHIVE